MNLRSRNISYFLKKIILNNDIIIIKRVFFVGIINTIVGPSILFLLIQFSNNLVESYFFMQVFMLFFKTILFKKIVLKEIKSKKSYMIPFLLVVWGLLLANFINEININEFYKAIILLILVTITNVTITLIGSRILKANQSNN
jgi:uncharacterized protein involved in response to NO